MRADRAFEESMDVGSRIARAGRARGNAHRRAFAIEAALLALFVAAALAVAVSAFGGAVAASDDAHDLSVAATLASGGAPNGLEDFAADPASAAENPDTTSFYDYRDGSLLQATGGVLFGDEYEVRRIVSSEATAAGTIYTAKVSVSLAGEEIYAASTSAYVSEREG